MEIIQLLVMLTTVSVIAIDKVEAVKTILQEKAFYPFKNQASHYTCQVKATAQILEDSLIIKDLQFSFSRLVMSTSKAV